VVGFVPGGGTDIMARTVAAKLGDTAKIQMVVENRPGANANLAAELVARAPADGYTVLMMSTSHAISKPLYKTLKYDLEKDLVPVAFVSSGAMAVVVHPAVPASNVSELIALAKAKPGELAFASAGVGAVHHIYAELLMHMTGIQMRHVPYRGGGAALNDVVAGHVPVYFADAGPAAPMIRAGQLTAHGVTTATRASHLPEVPTLQEAGVTGYEANTWQMMVGPRGMPEPIVMRLNQALGDFMRTPEAQKYFTGLGMQPTTSTPAEAADHIRKEAARWTAIIRGIGVSVD
jgi:tripartite-type tricarboxylate transporter receptor subunit TctC